MVGDTLGVRVLVNVFLLLYKFATSVASKLEGSFQKRRVWMVPKEYFSVFSFFPNIRDVICPDFGGIYRV